ncbi:ASCH domain-containing protein [Culicoidibacter larvae]|uniref:ASCH domain-containing protein n=1 Tax=Culicoidibacter larvae TaxID=2579976 RepID=A0A5R8Q7S5_9FIRM|nr:ASCH domain-containing protein [Culicoidibacter larvae]TLG71520.1 ASCH domain-containing protein [Culicoidibacter larvae]
MERIEQYWQQFLHETDRSADTKYLESFYFGSNEQSANNLLQLVLSGKKKATCSSLAYFEAIGEEVPKPGDFSIITDWAGTPFCVIQTKQVALMAFKDMTFDICKREGEDEHLESWQSNHIYFFTEEGKQYGYEFSWDMEVVFEDFEVVYTEESMYDIDNARL